jgi:hypothetical protein
MAKAKDLGGDLKGDIGSAVALDLGGTLIAVGEDIRAGHVGWLGNCQLLLTRF